VRIFFLPYWSFGDEKCRPPCIQLGTNIIYTCIMYVTELTHTHTYKHRHKYIHTCIHNLLLFSLIAFRVKAHYYCLIHINFFFFCEFFVYVYKDEQLRWKYCRFTREFFFLMLLSIPIRIRFFDLSSVYTNTVRLYRYSMLINLCTRCSCMLVHYTYTHTRTLNAQTK